jgi:hypothetical protein
LSAEYGVKAGYAFIIRLATHSAYGIADETIYASLERAPASIFDDKRITKIKDFGDNSYIVTMPHYQGFTDTALDYSMKIHYADIAGNDEILLTAVVPADWSFNLEYGALLFEFKDILDPKLKTVAIQAPVKRLNEVINMLLVQKIKIQHLYDY